MFSVQNDTELYYSDRWQVIAETQTQQPAEQGQPNRSFERTYVWTPGYVDELVERDEQATIEDPGQGTSQTDTRLYAQQDHNFNITSLTDAAGTVVQRFVYDPYGAATLLTASWAGGSDEYNWAYLHQGGRFDSISGLYHFRRRDYSPTLGRWTQQDPAGYVDGANLYEYVKGNSLKYKDPRGEAAW